MVILITGASHSGKTVLSQRLLEKYHYPYLSVDHLKMGLIRSGQTKLTPCDNDALEEYLWPIVAGMIKTAVENRQNLIVEGCYIPFGWKESFEAEYLKHIRYCCLILSEGYIENHFDVIRAHADDVEHRLDDSGLTKQWLIGENRKCLQQCICKNCNYILIEDTYDLEQIAGRVSDVFDL